MKLNEIKTELKKNKIEFYDDELYDFDGKTICKGLMIYDEWMVVCSKRGLRDLIENDEWLVNRGDEIGLVNMDGSGFETFDDVNEMIDEIKNRI